MCTVTYYRNDNTVILTSNRDEHTGREPALEPAAYHHFGKTLFYPKDTRHGGTWFCADEFNNAVILLNGAELKHLPHPPYSRSRGLVVIELFCGTSVLREWELIDIAGVEPFTLIVYEDKNLVKLQWNGADKKMYQLNSNEPQIFNSATLYSAEDTNKRKNWYTYFIESNQNISAADLLNFHTKSYIEDTHNGLLINRNNELITKSVTQLAIEPLSTIFKHVDLLQNVTATLCLSAHLK